SSHPHSQTPAQGIAGPSNHTDSIDLTQVDETEEEDEDKAKILAYAGLFANDDWIQYPSDESDGGDPDSNAVEVVDGSESGV
nr:hypothetical protein [Tanacetum cinerariifolium]